MAKVMKCPGCGEVTRVPSCPTCGAEQTLSDRDQTASDQDQTWSDHDQTSSDADQRSADDDQHAADDDLAAGGDAVNYHRSALARERSSRDRGAVSIMRDGTATERLRTGADRDRAAALRDRGAEGRDALARLHDLEEDDEASREDILSRAKRDRRRAAADRAKAADDRSRAAGDREAAARERTDALRLRKEFAQSLKLASTDELTGARTRKFGLEEAARELERAQRTGAALVVAFVDVDGLKQVNDREGHLAGDALLRRVGGILRANVRPYDVIVRYGGDELLCVMPNLTAADADARFDKIAAALKSDRAEYSVTVGLADAEPDDSLQELIGRADAALLEARR